MTFLTLPRDEDDFTRQATAEWQARVDASPVDTYLYRHFDADDRLLYVGATSRLDRRESQHARTSAWHSKAVRRTVQGPMHREHALLLETQAIVTEKPLHNRYRNNGYAGPGSVAWWDRVSALWRESGCPSSAEPVDFADLLKAVDA